MKQRTAVADVDELVARCVEVELDVPELLGPLVEGGKVAELRAIRQRLQLAQVSEHTLFLVDLACDVAQAGAELDLYDETQRLVQELSE